MATFTLSEDDYVQACRFLRAKFNRRKLWIFAVIAGVYGWWVVAPNMGGGVAVVFAVVVFAGMVALSRFMELRRMKRIYRQNVAPVGEFELAVEKARVVIKSRRGKMKLPWKDLRFYRENERFFLLHTGVDFAQIVPKSALSKDELVALEDGLVSSGTRRVG